MSQAYFRLAALLCTAALSAAAPAGAVNLIVNGSFETGPATTDALLLGTGSTAIAGWVVGPANVDYVGTRWTAAEGFRSVGLNGSVPGGISQTFATIPSEEYTVRFYMAGDPETLPVIKHLRVSAAGRSQDFDVDLTGMWSWDPGWNPRMFHFNATGTSTTLNFMSLEAGEAGPAVDSVTVNVSNPVDAVLPGHDRMSLSRMTPNPVRDGGSVEWSLVRAGFASVRVLDVRGREVAVLAHGVFPAGTHQATWNGGQGAGRAPAGIYLIELRTEAGRLARRVVLLP